MNKVDIISLILSKEDYKSNSPNVESGYEAGFTEGELHILRMWLQDKESEELNESSN